MSLAPACVPAKEHKQVVSALLAEQGSHRQTEQKVKELERRVAALQEALAGKEERLHAQELVTAQSQFDAQVVDKEREAASQLVEQLRAELARVGDNLRLYSEQKTALEAELEAALERAQNLVRAENRASMNAAVIRDYALLLPATLASGTAQLKLVDGSPELRVPQSELREAGAAELSPRAHAITRATAKLFERYPELAVRLDASPRSADDAALLAAFAAALGEAGIPSGRISVAAADDAPTEARADNGFMTLTLVAPE